MTITKIILEDYFQQALSELIGKKFEKSDDYEFEFISDMNEKRNYTSLDYYTITFYREHVNNPVIVDYDKIFALFVPFAETLFKYPISIELSLKEGCDNVICVKIDPRYRKTRELHNQETGHPPFKVIR